MAIDNQFGKGIGVAAGFDLGAQKPLDARVAVNTIAERDAHVTNNRAYEGMLVYVAEANMTYQLVKGEEEGQLVWKEFGFNQNDFDESFAGAIEDVDDRLKAVEADLAQGGEIEDRIAQNEADIDGLQGLVGVPAGDGVDATGLHLALDNAVAELEGAVAGEKSRAEGQEAAIRKELADEAAEIRGEFAAVDTTIRGEMAAEAQRVDKKIADDIAAESALRIAEEQRIEKALTDTAAAIRGEMANESKSRVAAEQKLTQDLAQEVTDRKAAVKDLADRHDKEMTAAEERLDDLEALFEGDNSVDAKILAAKQEALAAVGTEKGRAEGVEAAIRGEMATEAQRVDKKIADDIAAESALRVAEEQRIEGLVTAEAAKAREEEGKLSQAITTEQQRAEGVEAGLQAAINTLNGDAETTGSVAKAVADAKAEIDGAADALEARVKANEDKLAVVQGADTVEGSIAKAEKDAKAYADQQITALVDSAPDAMNTLNELAKAINDNKGVYDAWVVEHNKAMADMKKDLQDEIDRDVKVVADELAKQKDPAQEGTLAKQIATEKTRAEGQEAAIRKEFADADTALHTTISGETAAAVKVVSDELAKQKDAEQEGTLAHKIAAEASRATGAEGSLQEQITALKGNGEGSVPSQIAAAKTELQGAIKTVADNLANQMDGDVVGSLQQQINGAMNAIDAINTNNSALDQKIDTNVQTLTATDTELDEKITTLRTDMVNVFNALELTGEEAQNQIKIQLVLDGGNDMNNVKTPLGKVTLDVMTQDEVLAMLGEVLAEK